jgi:methionyl-tRNA formyltransferase
VANVPDAIFAGATMPPLRLAFMGTPDFAVPALNALVEAGHQVAAVYTQPPREAGRGQKPRPSSVHSAALERGILVRAPASLKGTAEHTAFAALGLDAAVVVAYGLLLPKPILGAPRLGCLNIHASLLPRWRGAAPIQRALMAGDAQTGITIMQMEEGLDTGPMLLQERMPIGPADDAGLLHDKLASLGAALVVKALDGVAAGTLTARPQPSAGVTYAAKVTRDDERLDWRRPAAELACQVRALSPRPGAWFAVDDDRLKALATEVMPEKFEVRPGTVLDDGLAIACGHGALRIARIQRPGRAPMSVAEFLRGYRVPRGAVLPSPGDTPP